MQIDCPEGNKCTGGSTYAVSCKDGEYCPIKTIIPLACPLGYYFFFFFEYFNNILNY